MDSCKEDNGAIKFIPGSHQKGILDTEEIAALRESGAAKICAAELGDIIMMRPLTVHSSSQSQRPEHRRVLHIEYTGSELPNGLKWAEGSGLDSVELLMAIEEEFGIDIPDKHAEGIVTVGMMYDYLKARISETPTQTCLTQRLFYKLRRALLTNFRLNRRDIRPETKLSDLMSTDEIEEGCRFCSCL